MLVAWTDRYILSIFMFYIEFCVVEFFVLQFLQLHFPLYFLSKVIVSTLFPHRKCGFIDPVHC